MLFSLCDSWDLSVSWEHVRWAQLLVNWCLDIGFWCLCCFCSGLKSLSGRVCFNFPNHMISKGRTPFWVHSPSSYSRTISLRGPCCPWWPLPSGDWFFLLPVLLPLLLSVMVWIPLHGSVLPCVEWAKLSPRVYGKGWDQLFCLLVTHWTLRGQLRSNSMSSCARVCLGTWHMGCQSSASPSLIHSLVHSLSASGVSRSLCGHSSDLLSTLEIPKQLQQLQ